MRANWRQHKDVTSFYFTRFPEDAIVEDLWYHFKQSGEMREVFIPWKRNRHGRRYGFVRFKGVRDMHQETRNECGSPARAYAEVVTQTIPRTEQRRASAKDDYTRYNSTSAVNLDIPLTGQHWLKEAWVDRLKNLALFDSIEDDMRWDSGQNISPKYLGDDMVLLLGLTEEKAA
ncbi:hypothetical protein GmHk_07G019703 [Glycine max]|nr:hypothetical protein GmHk_07G019703 [Glycine max]